MDSFKKPLSEKVFKRRLRREKEQERKLYQKLKKNAAGDNLQSNSSSDHAKLSQKHPPGLVGKEIGLWYARRKKNLSDEDREKRKKKDEQIKYKINLSPAVESTIREYLSSVQNIPPPSLVAQVKMLKKKLSQKNLTKFSGASDVQFTNLDGAQATDNIISTHDPASVGPSLSNNKGIKVDATSVNDTSVGSSSQPSCSNSNMARKISEPSEEIDNKEAINYWIYGGAEENKAGTSVANELNLSELPNSPILLSSIDKYKYLEDTPFKRKFLKNLTGTIESNLEQALYNCKLNRIERLDEEYHKSFKVKQQTFHYNQMLTQRKRLPAFKMQRDILDEVKKHQVILISGETGCGKTTQICQFILDDAIENRVGSLCSIVCTQPRRISAVSVANRVAQERCENVGQESIGYQIRLERKIGRTKGSILFCTTGILIQHLQSDPALSAFSHILLDEIHERDIICDFALTIIRDIIAKRKDLKVILMSATLNAEKFAEYFDNCPLIHIPGDTFPVEQYFLEDVLKMIKYDPETQRSKRKQKPDEDFEKLVLPYVRSLEKQKAYPALVLKYLSNPESEQINPDLIVELVKYICTKKEPGAILIFLPGWEDINTVTKKIGECGYFPQNKYLIIPLHSLMPTVNQQSVFDRPPQGVRKIIIATNIAETSITIDDVVYVIDSGKIKIKSFDILNNIATLKPEWVSRANAKQRRGRAGRVQPGICYHLFSKGRERLLLDYPLPEMLRTRLEEVILNVKLLQLGNVATFLNKVLDPPNPMAVNSSLQLLTKLNALDENENLTPLGYHLAQLPLDPQIGKMLLMACIMSCLDPVLSIAATLSFKDPFFTPLGLEEAVNAKKLELDLDQKSDHLIMVEAIKQWEQAEKCYQGKRFCSEFFLTRSTLWMLKDLKSQFARYLHEMGFILTKDYKAKNLNLNSENTALIKSIICAGLYPNVAVIRKTKCSRTKLRTFLTTSEDGNVGCHPKSINASQVELNGSFLVYHEKLKSSKIYLHDTTLITAMPMLLFGHGFNVGVVKGSNQIMINLKNDLNFSCSKEAAHLIKELRFRLDWLLEYKLSHPGEIIWDTNNKDASLLRTLIKLITYEDSQLLNVEDESDC